MCLAFDREMLLVIRHVLKVNICLSVSVVLLDLTTVDEFALTEAWVLSYY